jgi:hypothetical protein
MERVRFGGVDGVGGQEDDEENERENPCVLETDGFTPAQKGASASSLGVWFCRLFSRWSRAAKLEETEASAMPELCLEGHGITFDCSGEPETAAECILNPR